MSAATRRERHDGHIPRSIFVVACSAALVLLAMKERTARASEPSTTASPSTIAESLFEQGRELVLRKEYARACPTLAQSLRLDPGIGTMLYLADCYEKNGQTASAWAQFKQAGTTAAEQNDERSQVAFRRAENLEPRLTRLTLFLPQDRSVPGLEVRSDGMLLRGAELNMPLPIDPGFHTISAIAPGYEKWSATVDVPARAAEGVISINVPLLQKMKSQPAPASQSTAPHVVVASELAKPKAAPPVPTPAPSIVPVAPPQPSSSGASAFFGMGLGVLGVVGLGTGTYLGLRAKGTYDQSNANNHCIDNVCDVDGTHLRKEATSLAVASTIAVGAGLGACIAGVLLYTVPDRSSAAKKTSIAPAMGMHEARLVVTRAW